MGGMQEHFSALHLDTNIGGLSKFIDTHDTTLDGWGLGVVEVLVASHADSESMNSAHGHWQLDRILWLLNQVMCGKLN